jgi:predicted RNA-binding protein with RPS1 domain
MTETLAHPEAQSTGLRSQLEQWAQTPPADLSAALAEQGITVNDLEEYARSGISTDEAETLRRVLVQGAAGENPENGTVLARLTPLLDPRERSWDRVLKAKATGETLSATVTEATKGGVVVDLGVRGFVPASQLGLSVPRNLNQFIGRTLRVRVMEVDRRRQTVILTNRQVLEEERAVKRKAAIEKLEEGEVRQGIVRRITDIGAFVDVGGVDGLLHVSEISWNRVDHPSSVLTVGQKLDVKVLRVDPATGKVSLSVRRLTADPWDAVRRDFPIGTTVHAKVLRTVQQGAVVELAEGIEAFLPISELAGRRVQSAEEVVQAGQEIDAMVIDLQPRDRRIVLSLRKLEQKRERTEIDTYQKKAATTTRRSERTTLGDLFGHLFEEFKQEEEAPQPPAAAPAAEAPVAEAPVAEAPAAEAPAVEAPAVEAPAVAEAVSSELTEQTDQTDTAEPAIHVAEDESGAIDAAVDEPVTAEPPAAEAPAAEAPAAEAPEVIGADLPPTEAEASAVSIDAVTEEPTGEVAAPDVDLGDPEPVAAAEAGVTVAPDAVEVTAFSEPEEPEEQPEDDVAVVEPKE